MIEFTSDADGSVGTGSEPGDTDRHNHIGLE